VIDALRSARRDIARHLATADPDRVATARAAELVELFADIERLGAAGKVLFAERAAKSTVWRDQGSRSAASWMADKTGTGLGDAIATLETAAALQSLPETSEALRRGALSSAQVKAIATAAAGHPRAESELLAVAATHSLKGLKERCAQVRARAASAAEEVARYNAVKAARYVRHWADPDGAFRLDAKLTPDAGAKLLSAIEGEADARFAEARKAQDHDPPAAYMADALVALVTFRSTWSPRQGSSGSSGSSELSASSESSASSGSSELSASSESSASSGCSGSYDPSGSSGSARSPGTSRSQRSTVCIRVDAAALRRGYAESGETCHIPGVGPVPVATATRQLSDAFVKLLVTDGVDVSTVCHVGRSVPAHVQTALEERDLHCVVPGCDVAHGLENHHWDVPYAECGTSTLAGLARVCGWHHDLLTYDGYTLGGGPGLWVLDAPPGPALFDTG